METSDIFTTITRYSKPENRFTASLVYLLDYLWTKSEGNDIQRRILCDFLNSLCEARFAPDDDIRLVMLKTEKDEDEKRNIPDCQISSGNVLVWVEVKDTAPVERRQLKNYKNLLKERAKVEDYKDSKLVLLSHYSVSEKEKEGAYHTTWGMLYRSLAELRNSFGDDSISNYLLKEFLRYLEEKGVLAVKEIKGETIKTGFSDFISLLMLIKEEADQLFKDLDLEVREPNLATYEGENYVNFYVGKARLKKGNSYCIALGEGDPYSIEMQYNDGKDNWMDGATGDLGTVFEKNEEAEQRQEMGRLLEKMYQETEKVRNKEQKQKNKR